MTAGSIFHSVRWTHGPKLRYEIWSSIMRVHILYYTGITKWKTYWFHFPSFDYLLAFLLVYIHIYRTRLTQCSSYLLRSRFSNDQGMLLNPIVTSSVPWSPSVPKGHHRLLQTTLPDNPQGFSDDCTTYLTFTATMSTRMEYSEISSWQLSAFQRIGPNSE